MRSQFYNSWISVIILLCLIIFIPYRISFLTFKISDLWLLLCITLQFFNNKRETKIKFENRTFIKNFGLWMGLLAVTATLLQAFYDEFPIDLVYFSHFFRFLRYLLLFIFIENIFNGINHRNIIKFLNYYTFIGTFVIFISFLEYYSINPFQSVILNLYYVAPEDSLSEYLDNIVRLSGVMGNTNATAIFVTSTIVYPAFSLSLVHVSFTKKAFLLIYLILAIFVIFVMTGSRTAIFICIIVLPFIFFKSSPKIKNIVNLFLIFSFLSIIGIYIYTKLESKIVIAERVSYAFEGKDVYGKNSGLVQMMGRSELWQERITAYDKHAHQVALLIGMGYTNKYYDYADNGLLSSFLNLGAFGVLLRLILYYITLKNGIFLNLKAKKQQVKSHLPLIFGIISIILILWEISADLIEHIKLGQIFYIILSISAILRYNDKKYLKNANTN